LPVRLILPSRVTSQAQDWCCTKAYLEHAWKWKHFERCSFLSMFVMVSGLARLALMCERGILLHYYKIITGNMYLLKMSGPQILLCLFTFRSIASKQLNSLSTIDTFSWLGGSVITHLLWEQVVPGSIPGSGEGFNVWVFCFVVVVFLVFVQKHIICHKQLQFLLQC